MMSTNLIPTSNSSDDVYFQSLRNQMVEEQIRKRGIHDARVLEAMSAVPREEFVPIGSREQAYCDWALQIGWEQTISQPYTVAFMVEALGLRGDEKVLEIGTGSGYGAAVLSRLAAHVHTVERIRELADMARERLQRLHYGNVTVHFADGSRGLPEFAPYDAMISTAAASSLPPPLVAQLAPGGRIVIPIGGFTGQTMSRFTKTGGDLVQENLGLFALDRKSTRLNSSHT